MISIRALSDQSYEVRSNSDVRQIDLSYSAIMAGVPASLIRELQVTSVLEQKDIRRIIPVRTLERRLGNAEPLRPVEADGIARLLRVISHAYRVFEDEDLSEEWLRSPNPALNDEVPIAMAATDVGAREVEGVLIRLEHGVFD